MQPLAVVRSEFGDPIVIRFEACTLQVSIMETEKRHSERCVQHLGMNTVDVLVLETFGRVPSAGTRRLVALVLARLAEEILEFLPAPACGKAARDRETWDSGCDKKKIALVVTFDYPGSVVLILRVQPLDPQIGRFHHV